MGQILSLNPTEPFLHHAGRVVRAEAGLQAALRYFGPALAVTIIDGTSGAFGGPTLPRQGLALLLAAGLAVPLLRLLGHSSPRAAAALAGSQAGEEALFLARASAPPAPYSELLDARCATLASQTPRPSLAPASRQIGQRLLMGVFIAGVIQAIPHPADGASRPIAQGSTTETGSPSIPGAPKTQSEKRIDQPRSDEGSAGDPRASDRAFSAAAIERLAATSAGRELGLALASESPADDRAAWENAAEALRAGQWSAPEAHALALALESAGKLSGGEDQSALASAATALRSGSSAAAGAILGEWIENLATLSESTPTMAVAVDLNATPGPGAGAAATDPSSVSPSPRSSVVEGGSTRSRGSRAPQGAAAEVILRRYFSRPRE